MTQACAEPALQACRSSAKYAVFNAARAFHLSTGHVIDKHARVRQTFQAERARHCFGSLGLTMTGHPDVPATCTLNRYPGRVWGTAFNPLERREDPLDHVWAGLRLSRKWALRATRNTRLEQNKKPNGGAYKRLPAGTKERLASGLRPTTMLDLLYELGCSTNYRTVDEFAYELNDQDVAEV